MMPTDPETRLPNGKMPRRSFLPVIPEEDAVIETMRHAVDLFLTGDYASADELVRSVANVPVITQHGDKAIGGMRPDIHWTVDVELPPIVPKEKRAKRMPPSAVMRDVFIRDGYRCRFCDQKVAPPKAISRIKDIFPDAACKGARRNEDEHDALKLLQASVDHVLPHAYGGTNDPENLVTACGKCNYGRGNWTIEQCGMLDPRDYAPILDEWDGLMRLVNAIMPSTPHEATQ